MQIYSKRQPQPRVLTSHCIRNGLNFPFLHSQTVQWVAKQVGCRHPRQPLTSKFSSLTSKETMWICSILVVNHCVILSFFTPSLANAIVSQIHRSVILIFKYNILHFWCCSFYDLAMTSFPESRGYSQDLWHWLPFSSLLSFPHQSFQLFTVHSGADLHTAQKE